MSNVLLGGAIADALGMPFEKKLSNDPFLISWDGKAFLSSEHHGLKSGSWTDDTQFSMSIASSLIDNKGFNPNDLAKRYVELFTSNTIRGYGRTTKAAIDNLIAGKSYKESGIAGSFGNGGAMRVSPIGVYFRDDLKALIEAATIDAQITHASDEAIAGSIAIAMTAALACQNDTDNLFHRLCEFLPNSKVKSTIYSLGSVVDATTISPAAALAFLGTRADVKETVPSALYLFMKFDNYQEAVLAAINAGNDTDTTGAIIGSLFGARDGTKNIPSEWISGVEDSNKLMILDSQLYNRSVDSFFPRK